MDISIREHIINNFKGDDYNALKQAIDESVASQDEVVLPGLGVLLELFWNELSKSEKIKITNIIKNNIKKEN